jgi:hypothetical protein
MDTPSTEEELEHVKDLLEELAVTMTRLHEAGVTVEAKFNSIISDYGYCLQNDDGSWRARVKLGRPPKWWSEHDRTNPDDH